MFKTLKNKKVIDSLFTNGKKRVVNNMLIIEMDGEAGFLFAVSKKNFKLAVDRNRIKRLLREKVKGVTPTKSIALVYIGKELPTLSELNFTI